jgi:Rrf2 family protein
MLLTKKSEYALLSLILIAKSDTPKNVDELSNELFIPKPYLAKILQNFAKNNVLNSFKGVNGGFSLNITADKLTILQISQISEDKAPSVFECSPSLECCPSHKALQCNLWPVLNKLQLKIDNFLGSLTLKDIIQ